jgi:hypothetical protein
MTSSSKSSSKTVQKTSPYDPAQPAINQSIAGIQQWLSNPQSSAAYGGGMHDWTSQGLNNLASSAGATQSRDYLSDVLSGKFLNADNPWQADLDASIRAAVMPSINSTFSNAGMSGSTLHQGSVAQGLTSGLAAPRYQNYMAERANMGQAAGLLPQVDNQISQNLLTAGQTSEAYDRAKFEEQRLAGLRPYLETAPLLQGYGKMGGTQTGTTTSKSSPGLGQQIAGGVMTGVGLMTGMPQLGMIGTGVGNMMQGAPWSYGSSWTPWVQGA